MLPTNGKSPPRQTLTRSQRLLRRSDFLRVQEGGNRVTTRHLLILLAPRLDGETTRLGIVASRKMGAAVQRNRAKRLVRETFRRNASVFPDRVDLVVIVRPGVDELSQQELEAEIVAVAPLLRKRAGGDRRPGREGRGRSGPRG